MKRCPKCKLMLPFEKFSLRSDGRFESWCKPCATIVKKAYADRKKEHRQIKTYTNLCFGRDMFVRVLNSI